MESPQTPTTPTTPTTPNADDFGFKQLRGYVRNALDRLQKGEYFMKYGLDENVELLGNDAVNFPDPLDEEHPFNKFLNAVSLEVAADHFLKGKPKKKFAKQLERRFCKIKMEKWLSMINSRRTSGASMGAQFEEAGNTGTVDTGTDPMDIDQKDGETPPNELDKKQKAKKRKAESLVDGGDSNSQDADQETLIKSEATSEGDAAIKEEEDGQQVHEQEEVAAPRTDEKYLKKKAEFEKERDEILSDVPDPVMSLFGQVCFARWSREYLPVLVLNPFSVGPGVVRDLWLNMYDKVKNGGRLQNMTYLVYWYGSYEDPDNAYSLVTRKNILSYEDGVKKGLDQIPKAIQKKIADGKTLNGSQQMAKRGREEMAEDLLKSPELRRGRMGPFKESYEDDSDDEMPPEEFVDNVDENTDEGPKRKKQKKAKKYVDDAEEESKPKKKRGRPKGSKNLPKVKVEDSGDTNGPKKKPSKKAKKKDKQDTESKSTLIKKETSEVVSDAKMEDDTLPEQNVDASEQKVDAAVAYTVKIKEEQKELEAGIVGDIGDDDIPSDDDKDDEDAEILSESDENDLDFSPDDIAPKSKGKLGKPKTKATKAAAAAAASDEPKKKRGRPPKADKKPIDDTKARIRAEKKLFKELETRFRGLIQNWETALESKNKELITRILKEMLKNVDGFSAPFIEAYELPALTKNTKKFFECDARKELWKKMKEIYNSKKDLVPKGLKLERSQTAKKPSKGPPQPNATEIKDEVVVKTEAGGSEIDGMGAESQPEPASSNSLASLMKRSGSVERMEPAPDNSEESILSSVKGEKKKSGPGFSLGNLFKPASKETKTKTKAVRQPISSARKPQQQSFPSWLGEATLKELPSDKGREFALEFLQQAAPAIPSGKHVDHDAVARSLEFAIYDWAKESPVSDKYWNKIHDIVASISGNRKVGTLATLIGEGRFDSPGDLMKLSDDDLLSSFEGRPLML